MYCIPALMVVLAFYLKSTSATHPNHEILYCKRCRYSVHQQITITTHINQLKNCETHCSTSVAQ